MWRITCIFFFISWNFLAQKTVDLPEELKEISGIQSINDTLLIAHNDSGNKPMLFLISPKGKIYKKVTVFNCRNTDWEDITFDGQHIYISDLGNNSNNRKDLRILRIELRDLLIQDTVFASEMKISYEDQKDFPPNEKNLNFDCECLIFAEGNLWIFSKNRTEPSDGLCLVYSFKFEAGTEKKLAKNYTIKMGKRGWHFDSVTGGDYANGKFYVTTYTHLLTYELKNGTFTEKASYTYPEFNQKEALTVVKPNEILVANEGHKLLGKQKLYRITLKK